VCCVICGNPRFHPFIEHGTIIIIPEKITGRSGQDCHPLFTLPNWFSTNPWLDQFKGQAWNYCARQEVKFYFIKIIFISLFCWFDLEIPLHGARIFPKVCYNYCTSSTLTFIAERVIKLRSCNALQIAQITATNYSPLSNINKIKMVPIKTAYFNETCDLWNYHFS